MEDDGASFHESQMALRGFTNKKPTVKDALDVHNRPELNRAVFKGHIESMGSELKELVNQSKHNVANILFGQNLVSYMLSFLSFPFGPFLSVHSFLSYKIFSNSVVCLDRYQ